MSTPESKPVLHILVVGFHHKLGCQVEFSHPPLIPGSTGKNECPSGWKYLPTLALPDGSHNFVEDTVFFNLPSLMEPTESVYGISCYRQIPVEKLKIRTADVTRSTVQKSVCILTRLPIYGYIEVKLSLIADAFFDQGDFSCTDLLVKAYQQLNACLLDDESRRPLRHFHVGLSLREIVLHWRHKTLILFKLFLLQRRIVCFGSPVRGMCVLILGIASLIPRLLEKGFQEVACVRTSRPLSPMPDYTDSIQREAAALHETETEVIGDLPSDDGNKISPDTNSCVEAVDEFTCTLISSAASAASQSGSGDTTPQSNSTTQSTKELNRLDSTEYTDIQGKRNDRSNSLTRESSVDALVSTLSTLSAINPDEYRAPISIFASGNLCLPYLSLPYMDLLSDPSVLSYVIGTSNVLFRQKRQLADVLIDIENGSMDIHDQDLRRQIVLNTEDLRFMDFVLKHVHAPKEDAEGSENWIREQFQGYILALLRTAVASDATPKDNDNFNAHFMHAFKRTQCFQEWYDVRPEPEFFENLPAGHPFAGTLSVADMKLKIAQTMQNSESGRKINQAVNTTSRAVGGAISQAKGAFSNWWSSITTAPAQSTSPINNDNATISATSQQTQEISVTFQNSKNDNEEEIEVAVNIHLDETKLCSTNGNCSSSTAGSEKLIDSAEELEEDENIIRTEENKPPSEAEEAALQTQTQQQGIVEIGKEAEMLDKRTLTTAQVIPRCDANASHEEPQRSNGEIFIV
ncbi:late secretory pathway protein AVL9 homolog [Teleopsis dalmanni]|uniref:late secretory pathway protein AVL9 homolog n=1 Tax=Teleopsis dalmanni TaxID=139649 RepID=UPI0018CDAB30|nr:late secretory pathway protein AVL9 homolog [Teleopsis dalmanni]XP_037937754.1 late secretory pathway protein AVL9 homolog [Teleopsis dalmanni]